eukprot:scaffold101296_cov28-Tisochrysis_lutea.AAC.1
MSHSSAQPGARNSFCRVLATSSRIRTTSALARRGSKKALLSGRARGTSVRSAIEMAISRLSSHACTSAADMRD